MLLNRVDDPRDLLGRLTRKELQYLARKEGRTDIEPGMPVQLMVKRFRDNPPKQLPRPLRPGIGSARPARTPPYNEWLKDAFPQQVPVPAVAVEEPPIPEVDATSDLERQWRESRKADTIQGLRIECKRRGIKMERTDKTADLKAKLNG